MNGAASIAARLGHTKLESTVRYLGNEVDNALEIVKQTERSPATLVATAEADGRLPAICSHSAPRSIAVVD